MCLAQCRVRRRGAGARMILYLSLRAVAYPIQTHDATGPKITHGKAARARDAARASRAAWLRAAAERRGRAPGARCTKSIVAERSGTALQEAMRQALVRATGRREAADDPALASIVADAPEVREELHHRRARASRRWCSMAAAVQQAITAAGRSVWDARPSLHPGGARPAAHPRRRRMRRAPSWSASPPRAACRSA